MSGYKKVLVAVDGSSCSEKAVGVAVNFCRLSNAELHTIFVISDMVVDNFKRLGKSQANEVLESLKDELIEVISRYVAIDPAAVHIDMEQDGRQQRLIADIPLQTAQRRRK